MSKSPGIMNPQGSHGTEKTGNLGVHFSRRGKHREFAKNIKNMILHREFTSNRGKLCCPGLWWNLVIIYWLFDAKFEMVDNPMIE